MLYLSIALKNSVPKFSFEKYFQSLYVTTNGYCFSWCIWRTVIVNLWKSDKSVSKFYDFKNGLWKFVRSKSLHEGLSGFFKHVGSLIKLCKWHVPQKFSIADSVISELKSPTKEILVYFHLRIQYFSENMQMIWNKILMRIIETT